MSSSTAQSSGSPLQSELAHICLPATRPDWNQNLAWVNSLCLAYVVIGMIGLRPPAPIVRSVHPIEEPAVMVIEPPAVTPMPVEETNADQDETPPDPSDAPAVVAVTLESPLVVFSVPTVGNVLVEANMAKAPPLRPLETQLERLGSQVINLRLTGRSGNYPQPDYPYRYLQARMSGTIILLITVDDAGMISKVEVRQSTGFVELDNHTIQHVRRRFTFPAGEGVRTYQLPVVYQLPGS